MSKIETLTPEQESRIPEWRDKWVKIGLSTEPANRPEAEKAIRESYRQAGLAEPKKIVWCGSPLSQCLTRAIILDKKLIANIGDSVRASVRASVGDSVWASVGDSVGDSVRDSVRDSVGASVWASVWDSVWASVRDSVWASVGDSVRDSVVASVRDSVWASGYGAHDAGWLSFYSFFREVCNLEAQTEKLAGLFHLAQNAGWWLPHEHICWVSERHRILERDERGRLHNPSGAAILYPDGWAIYAWHGIRVAEDVILHPESITTERIIAEKNQEIRRVLMERFGQDKFLVTSGAKMLHADEIGELYRTELPYSEPLVMVKVLNSTPEPDGTRRPYYLGVHPELRPLLGDNRYGDPQPMTARNAVASTFGLKGEDYSPEMEA